MSGQAVVHIVSVLSREGNLTLTLCPDSQVPFYCVLIIYIWGIFCCLQWKLLVIAVECCVLWWMRPLDESQEFEGSGMSHFVCSAALCEMWHHEVTGINYARPLHTSTAPWVEGNDCVRNSSVEQGWLTGKEQIGKKGFWNCPEVWHLIIGVSCQ